MNMNMFNAETLIHTHPIAAQRFREDLLDNDSCLFYVSVGGTLCAVPRSEEAANVGDWTMVWFPKEGVWRRQ
jgi:hypothetical protein